MVDVRIDFGEVNTLAADLGRGTARTVSLAHAAIAKAAADIEADAKQFAPVDTGALRNSISTSQLGLTAEVGPTVEYGLWVEQGTSRMAPHAYLGPAFDRRIGGLEEALTRIAEGFL